MALAATNEGQMALSGHGRVARVDVMRDMAQAEAVWRDFERSRCLATPYQRFDLLNQWQTNVGVAEGTAPLVVIAYDRDGHALALLPFGVSRENGANVARFLGGKHTTFNMGVWRADFAASLMAADIDQIWDGISKSGERVDLMALTQQPRAWAGQANPFVLLAGQPSPNGCPVLNMAPNASPNDIIGNSFRGRIRSKERKLSSQPGYRYLLANTDDDINQILDAFFVLKPQRMAAQNLPNVFAHPGVEDFIRQTCLAKLADGGRAIVIHALMSDAEMIAMFAGVADGQRFSMMFNTYTLSDNAKFSPGVVLLRHIIDYYASLGYKAFDLGIGTDDYKRQLCKDDEAIFDSFVPLTARGRLTALGMSSMTHAKRIIKQNPALVQMANRVRSTLHI